MELDHLLPDWQLSVMMNWGGVQWKEMHQSVRYQAFEKYGEVRIIKTMLFEWLLLEAINAFKRADERPRMIN